MATPTTTPSVLPSEFQKSKSVTPTTTDAKVRKPTRPPGAKLPSSQTQPAKSTKKSFTGKGYIFVMRLMHSFVNKAKI